jgi:Holliday junction resolvasome RuvABC endonuclease subunit
MRALGIDCGLRNLGLAVVEVEDSDKTLSAIAARVVVTVPDKTKKHTRTASADLYRYKELHNAITRAIERTKPDVIGIETYVIPGPAVQKVGGNAWKVTAVYGLAIGIALSHSIPVFPFSPAEAKKLATGKASASKQHVIEGMQQKIANITDIVEAAVPQKSLWEHAYDASAHAMLALVEAEDLRSFFA